MPAAVQAGRDQWIYKSEHMNQAGTIVLPDTDMQSIQGLGRTGAGALHHTSRIWGWRRG